MARALSLEYVIYCDESDTKGAHFSNFYGGALVSSTAIDRVRSTLAACKADLNFNGEVKWQKISAHYVEKYKLLMDVFFDLVAAGDVKFRVMFTQNMYQAVGLSAEQKDNAYFLLYYQFIKHSFGLRYRYPEPPVRLRLYLDQLPDTREKADQFKSYLAALSSNRQFVSARVTIRKEDIADVDSKEHDILQCLDVVLGAINFRLNDKNRAIPEGKRRRGARTIAKEKVYKHILKRIQAIYPYFNIGISTGTADGLADRWIHPYRHWRLIPNDHRIVGTSKRKKKDGG